MALLKRCLGVDLGQHTIKIVELALERNAVRTIRAASGPTGVHSGMDPEMRRQAVIAAARDLLKKNRFSTKDAVYAIPGQKVFTRRFRLPKTTEERLEKIVQYEARQQIPFPLDRTILQYQWVEVPGEGEVEVMLVAVRTDEVREFMSIVDKIGPRPVAISVSSFALFSANNFLSMTQEDTAKLFESLSKKKKAPAKKKLKKGEVAEPEVEDTVSEEEEFSFEEIKCFVNIGASYFDLAIPGKAGLVGFVRTVPMGGEQMTKAIMKNLGVESFDDAERIKVSSTQLMTFNFDFESEGETNEEASLAVSNAADNMVKEIRRSLDFYITQPDGMAVDRVMLSGGQASLGGMESYLEEKLAIPVEIVSGVSDHSPLKWQNSAGPLTPYMIAIGLAVHGMGLSNLSIDFLPNERKITRDFPYRITAVMAILLLAMIGVATQAGKQYSSKFVSEAQGLRSQVEQTSAQVTAFEESQALNQNIANRYKEFSKAFGQRDYWLDFVGQLAQFKPPEVLLQDVRMEHDGRVIIVGFSEVQVSAADFVNALKEGFPAERVELEPNIEGMLDLPTGGTRFTITMKMKDKINHLDISPTPTPAQPGGNR